MLTYTFEQQKQAQATLNQVGYPQPSALPFSPANLGQFKENPDAWLLVDKILQDAQYPQTKCESANRWSSGGRDANCEQIWVSKFSTM